MRSSVGGPIAAAEASAGPPSGTCQRRISSVGLSRPKSPGAPARLRSSAWAPATAESRRRTAGSSALPGAGRKTCQPSAIRPSTWSVPPPWTSICETRGMSTFATRLLRQAIGSSESDETTRPGIFTTSRLSPRRAYRRSSAPGTVPPTSRVCGPRRRAACGLGLDREGRGSPGRISPESFAPSSTNPAAPSATWRAARSATSPSHFVSSPGMRTGSVISQRPPERDAFSERSGAVIVTTSTSIGEKGEEGRLPPFERVRLGELDPSGVDQVDPLPQHVADVSPIPVVLPEGQRGDRPVFRGPVERDDRGGRIEAEIGGRAVNRAGLPRLPRARGGSARAARPGPNWPGPGSARSGSQAPSRQPLWSVEAPPLRLADERPPR